MYNIYVEKKIYIYILKTVALTHSPSPWPKESPSTTKLLIIPSVV